MTLLRLVVICIFSIYNVQTTINAATLSKLKNKLLPPTMATQEGYLALLGVEQYTGDIQLSHDGIYSFGGPVYQQFQNNLWSSYLLKNSSGCPYYKFIISKDKIRKSCHKKLFKLSNDVLNALLA